MSAIEQKDFEKYEAMILSDKMTSDQVHFFLLDNKEFAHWYLDRVPARMEKKL